MLGSKEVIPEIQLLHAEVVRPETGDHDSLLRYQGGSGSGGCPEKPNGGEDSHPGMWWLEVSVRGKGVSRGIWVAKGNV